MTVRQSCRAPHRIIQRAMSEGLTNGPYVAARVGFEPVTFCTEGTKPTNEPPCPYGFSFTVQKLTKPYDREDQWH